MGFHRTVFSADQLATAVCYGAITEFFERKCH